MTITIYEPFSRAELRNILLVLGAAAALRGCEPDPGPHVEVFHYGPVRVSVPGAEFSFLDDGDSRLRVRTKEFYSWSRHDLLHESRIHDSVSVSRGRVNSWTSFYEIAKTPVGRLILEQRAHAGSPGGSPWHTFRLGRREGEIPVEAAPIPSGANLEQFHLVYVFSRRHVVFASYDSNGHTFLIELNERSGGGTCHHPDDGGENALHEIGFPDELDSSLVDVTAEIELPNRGFIHWGFKKPSDLGNLAAAFLVRDYGPPWGYSVERLDSDRERQERSFSSFQPRPFDAQWRQSAAEYRRSLRSEGQAD